MNISFFGLGKMGNPMASHLAQQGHSLTIYNRTQSKAEAWLKQHDTSKHTLALSAADACKECDILIMCVGNDTDVENLLFGKDGAHETLKPGTLVIDHTTTSADLAKNMHKQLSQLQVDFVDAPVSGGEQGAINGQLSIMCGGDLLSVERAKTATAAYSKAFNHMGEPGTGQLTKMVNQICVAGLVEALAEGIHFGQKAGLDMEKVMQVVGAGAGSSWQLVNRHKTMLNNEYNFGFAIDHMRKDLDICLTQARKIHAQLPSTALVDQFYGELQQTGDGQLDTSALLKRLQRE